MAQARGLALDPPDYARLAGLESAFDDGVPGDEGNVLRLVAAADRVAAARQNRQLSRHWCQVGESFGDASTTARSENIAFPRSADGGCSTSLRCRRPVLCSCAPAIP